MVDIGRFLKYGTAMEFGYRTPVPIDYDITFDDAKVVLKSRIIESLDSFPQEGGIAMCGTVGACFLSKLLDRDIPSWSVDVGLNTRGLAESLGLTNHVVNMQNVEESLIALNRLYDFPRASIEDVYAYSRQMQWSSQHKTGICEGGSDFLFLNSTNMDFIALAMGKGHYKISRAMQMLGSKPVRSFPSHSKHHTYSACFNDIITIFNDDELGEMGVECPDISLFEDTPEDYLMALFEWGYRTVYLFRTRVLAEHFGFRTFSPFINDPNVVHFCLSLPIEMKYCMGYSKHILKEAVEVPKETRMMTTPRLFPAIYNKIKPEMDEMVIKYLKDRDRLIFSYLNYDAVQKHLNQYIKVWNLLSLAIWLEVHQS